VESDLTSLVHEGLKGFSPELRKEILLYSQVAEIPAETEILREGQYIKVLPIVLTGLIKVFTRHDERELLLYYIKPEESCIMSFASGMNSEPSKVFAITEEDSQVLLLPIEKLSGWIKQYPDINKLFFQLYNTRYSELILTINGLLFDRMDKRLMSHLLEKSELTGKNPLKISHRQLSAELGTAREVISRVMKRLEQEGKVKQHTNSIEIL
jgi:CRP/FNR family transcriptional regulator, anaerobic regulatory protein